MRHQSEIKKDETGFTLVEMIVTCCIMGILAAIAIPGFSSLMPNYRLRLAAQELLSNFQLAKITAIKRSTNCTITFSVPSSNKYVINNDDAVYVVYVDTNRNLKYDTGEQIIAKKRWADYNNNVSFDINQVPGLGIGNSLTPNVDDLPSLSFRSNGMPVDKDGKISGGSVFLISTKKKSMYVNISKAGSVSIVSP